MRALAAITWLYAADAALALHAACHRLAGITAETPLYRRLNVVVTYADANPHLPSRYRDPRDVADSAARI
ncbi:hypothetical protein OG601_47270 [Streptomyces sp. NBC_01239]|uniref:hypothetical protein n=1 Tax=Streptomyces sp. NBC_01239 TaxID=2903792 RepID=UPI002252ED0D|nr:hypothetical protein [Streptomyces sp. NBC_01239]MCX4809006.1 hypothetical protein [Streptomyces sp. NBC_01239]MCX4816728.1 hypothetical protein [Streptomyces sp. NBC_01239]MCX4818176.1 hypothetical protein [Streptomyces sp. NBC_01239]